MGSMNKVILIGNLGRDAEVRATPSGTSVASLRLATTDSWRDKDSGERKDKTEWHSVVLWGRSADALKPYLTKGKQIAVEGSLQTKTWDDKTDGTKKYRTEIRADRITLLGGGGGGERSGSMDRGGGATQAPGASDEPPIAPITDDDIPF